MSEIIGFMDRIWDKVDEINQSLCKRIYTWRVMNRRKAIRLVRDQYEDYWKYENNIFIENRTIELVIFNNLLKRYRKGDRF